jgi:serine protease Do
MRTLIRLTSCLLFLAHSTSNPALAAPPPNPDLPDLVEKVLPGVVNISSTTVLTYQVFGMEDFLNFWGIPKEHKEKQSSLGTGFIIDKDGYVLTNNHVVERATEVMVTLLDKKEYQAKIIGKDQKLDLALLQIRGKDRKVPADLKPVALGDSSTLRIAESVFAVGNPFGLQHTVTIGIISAKNRTIGQGPFDDFLQTDASINPGNSGGPLFNLKGEVIGINTVIYSRTGQSGGLGFAIPVNEAKGIIPELKRYGRVPRPWLGIVSQRMTLPIQRAYQLPSPTGVLVTQLVQDGPGDEGNLRSGDIIVEIDGTPVLEPNQIEKALAKHKPTDSISIRVLRGKKTLNLPIHLEELPRLDNLPPGII